MTSDIGQIVLTSAIPALALASLFLSRRSPSWRPLSASLPLLSAIDLARLVTAPHAALREWGWWQADVCLCALWPVAIGVGLARRKDEGLGHNSVKPSPNAGPRGAPCGVDTGFPLPPTERGGGEDNPRRGRAQVALLARLASLCSLAVLLGALRPWLPRVVYLTGLRFPRWALAGLWVEALALVVLSSVDRAIKANASSAGDGNAVAGGNAAPSGLVNSGATAPIRALSRLGLGRGKGEDSGRDDDHSPSIATLAPLACSLILAACNTADLVAGAWLVAPWQPPAWQYARAVTWAAYAGVGVVMGWEAVRGR